MDREEWRVRAKRCKYRVRVKRSSYPDGRRQGNPKCIYYSGAKRCTYSMCPGCEENKP